MTTQTAPVQFGVVPDASTSKEIENTIDAPRILAAAIEDFKSKRVAAEAAFANSLAKDLAVAPLNVESAIGKEKAWKASDEALVQKIKAAEELLPIIEEQIDQLKEMQPDAMRTVLQRKLDQLEKEAAAEKEQAALLRKQIESLKALLCELDKPAATAKRKK